MTQNELSFWRSVCAKVYATKVVFPPGPEYDGHRADALVQAGKVANEAVRALRAVRRVHPSFGLEVPED